MNPEKVRKILVIAIARSGHHAVMHWLCHRFDTLTIHLNNCNQDLKHRDKTVYNKHRPGKTLVYSFENFDLRGFKEYDWDFDDVIIVNRDPYNLIASSLAKKGRFSILIEPITSSQRRIKYDRWWCESLPRYDMFFQYMEQCLGEKDYLGRKFYHINYNKWFTDTYYRMKICAYLDVSFGDSGMDYVPVMGSGSSFDELKYRGKGSEMDVLNRWQHFVDDERFRSLVSDPRIKHYSEKYFNFIPEFTACR